MKIRCYLQLLGRRNHSPETTGIIDHVLPQYHLTSLNSATKEKYIRAKYEHKEFVRKENDNLDEVPLLHCTSRSNQSTRYNQKLYFVAKAGQLGQIICLLAQGANINSMKKSDDGPHVTPYRAATLQGQTLAATLLVLNGCADSEKGESAKESLPLTLRNSGHSQLANSAPVPTTQPRTKIPTT